VESQRPRSLWRELTTSKSRSALAWTIYSRRGKKYSEIKILSWIISHIFSVEKIQGKRGLVEDLEETVCE
jgi:hypothetical protein